MIMFGVTSTQFKNLYSELKAQVESFVLLANDIDGLLTCALLHNNVFGPGDKVRFPSLIEVAKFCWAVWFGNYILF